MLHRKFHLSKHAIQQMKARGISEDEINLMLENPEQIINEIELQKTIYQGIIHEIFC